MTLPREFASVIRRGTTGNQGLAGAVVSIPNSIMVAAGSHLMRSPMVIVGRLSRVVSIGMILIWPSWSCFNSKQWAGHFLSEIITLTPEFGCILSSSRWWL